jgi:hypothetical protein
MGTSYFRQRTANLTSIIHVFGTWMQCSEKLYQLNTRQIIKDSQVIGRYDILV